MLYRPSEETQILGRALAEAGFESSKELRPYESKSWVYRNFAALLSRVSDQLDVAREDEQAAEGLRAGVVSILTDYATCTCQDTYLDVSSLSVPQCVEALYSLRSMGIFMNFAVVYMHPSYFYVIEGLIETVHLFSPRNLGGVDGRLFEDNTWLNFEADGLPLLECMDMYCMPTDRLRLLR
jgi:hypothetical protein